METEIQSRPSPASVLDQMDQNVKLFRTRVKIGNWNQERYLEEVCFKVNEFIHVSYTTCLTDSAS